MDEAAQGYGEEDEDACGEAEGSFYGTDIALFRGGGDGSFQPAGSYPDNSLYDVAVGDLDADGRNDLVVSNSGLPGIQVLMGGIGAVGMQAIPLPVTPRGLAVADLDGDGFDDILLRTPVEANR